MFGSTLRRLSAGLVVVAAIFATQTAFATGPAPDDDAEVSIGVAAVDAAIEPVFYGDDIDLVSAHRVVDNELVGWTPAARNGWLLTESVVPEPYLGQIEQFGVFTDGLSGTLAMVHRSSRSNGWIVSVDEADLIDVTLMRETLVHELAHIVTLGAEDVTFTASVTGPCDAVELSIGCVRTDATLARYAARFWSDEGEPATYDVTRHVNDYAASSVHEDLAESFLAYVLGGASTDEAEPAVVEAKFAFFAEDAELGPLAVTVREMLDQPLR